MANIYNGTTAPVITVEFDLNALGPSEPGASIWTPVPTGDIRALSVRRGKTVENQAVQPGVLTLTLDNQSGDYDPEKMASPWTITSFTTTISAFSPRLGVRVKATWNSINYVLYQGYMETLDLDYGLNPTATLTFVDGLSYLGAVVLPEQVISVGFDDTIKDRAARVCNELIEGVQLWPTGLRNFSSVLTNAMYGTKYGDTALNEIQTAADCWPGRVFISNAGLLNVVEWFAGTNRGLILSDANTSGVIGYDAIEVDPGAKYLVNSVTVNKIDGNGENRGTVVVENAASMLRYGSSAKVYDLPIQEAKPAATFYANQYSSPADRVKSVSFSALNFASQFPKLLATELADFCQVVRHTMDGRTLSFNCQVEGIEYDLTPEDWRVRFITSVVATIPSPSPGPEPLPPDPIAPNPPTGLTGTTAAYIDFREPRAQVSLTWTAPTQNTDGTDLTDLRWYEVQYKLSSNATWLFGGISYSTTYIQSNLTVNTGYDFRVFAVDSSNNRSTASNTFTITSANVTTFVGATPSTPTVSSRLGTIKIEWDGKNNGGGAMPSDFWFVEVHVSTTSGFTPTASTFRARMMGADYVVLSDLTYSTTYYVKLVAYSQTNVASTPSAEASSSIQPLVNTDIINNTITGAKIQNGTITASDKVIANTITGALIQALAISADKIQANAITADKISAGAIDGQIITGAVVRTSSGSTRAEMNNNGLYFYNGGTPRVQFLNNGTASIGDFSVQSDRLSYGTDVVLYSSGSGLYALDTTRTVQAKNFTATGSGVTNAIVAQTGNIVATGGEVEAGTNLRAGSGVYTPNAPTTSSFSANAFLSSPSGLLYRVTSSERYKTDIQDAALPAQGVLALEPKTFVDKNAAQEAENIADVKRGLGLIAEEVAAIPGIGDLLVNRDEEGRPDSINYDRVAVALIDVIKDLSARVAALEASN